MGLFSNSKKSDDKPLPMFAFRGRNEQTGKRENYLLRWGCEKDEPCEGLFRTHGKAKQHDRGHRK